MGEIEDVTASRNGRDREALARLIGRYQAPVYNYHLKFLRDPHDAADATQRSFLNTFEGYESGFVEVASPTQDCRIVLKRLP